MSSKPRNAFKNYWDENISKWGDLYLQISHGHESLNGNRFFTWLYNRLIVPYEAKLMKQRYKKTVDFINTELKKGATLNDLGCGTGIFIVESLKKGVKVNAIDLSETSLQITQTNVDTKCPTLASNVEYFQADAQEQTLPEGDVTICVGVLPYIENLESFMQNLLGSTQVALVQYTERKNIFNFIRSILPFLNVRNLQFQTEKEMQSCAQQNGFEITGSEPFATGRLLIFRKKKYD